MTQTPAATESPILRVRDEIRRRQRFLLTSHARPDGDSIGSQLAMAFALDALGKDVRLVNADRAPDHYQTFPGMDRIEIAAQVDTSRVDAVVVMECGDLVRTGVAGVEHPFIINIDHHAGNSMYGAINWYDETAAACGEMVFDAIRALDVPLSLEIATHVYLAILTDTGAFHHSNITPRTFDICRQTLEAGVDPVLVARSVYDSNSLGRLKLFGTVMSGMQLDASGRIALVYLDHEIARVAGGTYEDTEGLINLPLTVKDIEAVVFFKHIEGDDYRVSLRSKRDIDVGAVAKAFGGGGHRNAAGCTASGTLDALRTVFVEKIRQAIDGCPPGRR